MDRKTLCEFCNHFTLGKLIDFRDAGGFANKNFELQTDFGEFFVKFTLEHSTDELEAEFKYLDKISSHGIPCTKYLRTKNRELVFFHDGNLATVQSIIVGKQPTNLNKEIISVVAETLAKIHKIDIAPLAPRRTWWSEDYFQTSLILAKNRFGNSFVSDLENKIQSLPKIHSESLPQCILHGDPWHGNTLFKSDNLIALVDWEETTVGPAILDIAWLAVNSCFPDDRFDPGIFNALLEKYESIRALGNVERELFSAAVDYVICTSSLWLLLKSTDDITSPEKLEVFHWFYSLDLSKLNL